MPTEFFYISQTCIWGYMCVNIKFYSFGCSIGIIKDRAVAKNRTIAEIGAFSYVKNTWNLTFTKSFLDLYPI